MLAKYRHRLPQLNTDFFLTDGGLETTLIFHEGEELPLFAAFPLLDSEDGRKKLRKYFTTYAQIAQDYAVGIILETVTWRASKDWAKQLGYSADKMSQLSQNSVDMLLKIREEYETPQSPIVISGCIGPRGDGYRPNSKMTIEQAEQYHGEQIKHFQNTSVDMITAFTISYTEEAIGICRASAKLNIPVVISFTVELDGNLPNGQTLQEAIETVDLATDSAPIYYMINCAHPSHFDDVISTQESWVKRIGGLRANASNKSHAELDEAEELDDGNPIELGQQYHNLRQLLPNLIVMGGCCGTDQRHIIEICNANLSPQD
ncbi:MAG: homocysteine S-methyltransferase family protein [Phototrophicaceae bacterium]